MDKKDLIIKDYENGKKVKDIINKYKCSLQYVYYVLRTKHIQRNRPRGIENKRELALKAIEEYKKGFKSQMKVCEKYKISYMTFVKYRGEYK